MKIDHIFQILISLALIYFLFSTLTSVIFEWYSHKTQKRGRFLYEAIHKLINDAFNQSFGATLYSHYSIDRLKRDKDSYPQYISSAMFSDALIDVIGRQSEAINFDLKFKDGSFNIEKVDFVEDRITNPYDRFVVGVNKMAYSPFKTILRAFCEKSNDYASLKTAIAEWYDDYMERVSGWYKVKTKRALFFIGLLVTLVFNLDSIRLVKTLNQDDGLRKNLLLEAERVTYNNNTQYFIADTAVKSSNRMNVLKQMAKHKLVKDSIDQVYFQKCDSIISTIDNLSIPVGYHSDFGKQFFNGYGFFWLIGILFSAFALSFGAPFWFDVMVKVINVRRAGIKPKETSQS
jgi:hypothetical protein